MILNRSSDICLISAENSMPRGSDRIGSYRIVSDRIGRTYSHVFSGLCSRCFASLILIPCFFSFSCVICLQCEKRRKAGSAGGEKHFPNASDVNEMPSRRQQSHQQAKPRRHRLRKYQEPQQHLIIKWRVKCSGARTQSVRSSR